MIPDSKKGTIRILKGCIHYLKAVDIYGEEAIDLAECIRFLQKWLELAESTPATMVKFKRESARASKVNKKRSK